MRSRLFAFPRHRALIIESQLAGSARQLSRLQQLLAYLNRHHHTKWYQHFGKHFEHRFESSRV